MGKAYMRLSLEMLRQTLGLPDDVEIVASARDWHDEINGSTTLLLHSTRFPEPAPGEKLSEVQAVFTGTMRQKQFQTFQTVA